MSYDAVPDRSTGHPRTVPDRPASAFWPGLPRGLLTAAFGLALLAWPHVSVHLLGILVGLWFLLVGVAHVFGGFVRWRGLGWQVLSGALGILFVVAGVACLRDVTKGVLVLAFLIALAWIFIGLAQLVTAAQTTGTARTWLVVLGIAALVIGMAFLLWPAPSVTAIVILAGIGALVIGVAEVALALRLRRLEHQLGSASAPEAWTPVAHPPQNSDLR